MHLNLKNSIAFFDLEATGTNVSTDRIVEISIVKLNPDGGQQIYTRRVNPGVPIPLEASLIHGLYDKDLKNEPYFKDLAQEVFQFIGMSDLAGFNVLKYDIPLLVEEFLRSGIDFDLEKRNLLDSAYKFYCGKKLENAHSAEADTLATVDVFRAQMERYLGETAVDLQGNTLGVFENDMKKIHALVNERMVDLAGRFIFDAKGQEVFNFGKHKGKTIEQALKEEPGYYEWMMKGDFPLDTKRKLTQIKLRGFNAR